MLYFEAKRIISAYQNKEGSIESLIAKSQFNNKNLLKCLTIKTLKHKKLLEKIIKRAKLLDREQFLGDVLAQLLVYDLLFGIGVRGKFKGLVKRNYDSLNEALTEFMTKYQVNEKEELLRIFDDNVTVVKPKYIFLNTLVKTKKEIKKQLKNDNYTESECDLEDFKQKVEKLKENEFFKDDLIKHLMVFSSNSTMNHQHDLFKEGHLMQVDKSSCMAPFALNPPEGSFVIDACAAPGNKTLLLANIMKNTGLIYAFDIDQKRVEQMNDNLKSHHAKCVRLRCNDFLSIDPDEYERVEYILLDPSCSGSGMVNRFKYGDAENEQIKDDRRLWNLEALQRKMLLHAMSFANVKRIVYSTCSIHQEENENVVLYALKNCDKRFELVNVHPEWVNRGRCIEDGFNLEYCIRTDMKDNLTNGFFIACFNRVDDTEESTEHENGNGEEHDDEEAVEEPAKKRKHLSDSDKNK